jgi:hypothetical protein
MQGVDSLLGLGQKLPNAWAPGYDEADRVPFRDSKKAQAPKKR